MDTEFLNLVAATLKTQVENLEEEATVETLPEWTSLSHWEVIGALEEEYGVEFTMDEATEFKNLGDLYQILQSKL